MATVPLATPISKLIVPAGGSTSATSSTSTTGSNAASLGANEFLSLLTTELKNQDPLNPVDSTQSVAQLAHFSALQATTTMSNQFTSFESNFAVSQASGMLGESVTVATTDASGNPSTTSGTVKSIAVTNGSPTFTMVDASGNAIAGTNGTPLQFNTSQITGITK